MMTRFITSINIARAPCPIAEDGGGRAALPPLRRGRPDPPSLSPASWSGERDREGRAQDEEPLRRPARAVLPRAPRALRGPLRAAHGPERGNRRPARPPA